MRLLMVNWRDIRNPEAGGADIHLHEVARRMVAAGHDCLLYCHQIPGRPRREVIDGVEVRRRGNRWLFNFTVWAHVRRWERLWRPDLVLDDSNKIPFFLPLLCRTPVVVRVHHLFGAAIFSEAPLPMAAYVWFWERLAPLCWRGVPVLTVSPSTREELERLGCHRIGIALNGVDHSRLSPRGAKKKLVLYMGRLKRYKRLDFLLEAFALVHKKIPEARLIVAGSGDDLPRLRRFAEKIGIADRVTFPGFVTEEDKAKLCAEASVFANPSSKEGWGITTIEANACGTPVVAADVPGLRDSVLPGKTGFLIPAGDREAFAEKISLLLRDQVLREDMGREAAGWARGFTWERTAESTTEFLTGVLEGRI